jgi:hypothetical protein
MLRLSLLLLLLLPQPGQNPQPEPPATEPEAPTVAYDEGPLRVEFVAMREVRMRAAEPELAGRMQSDLRIQVRIAGEPLKQVAQYGNVILTEMVDDQGKSLINDDTYTDEEREIMRPLNIPVTRLAQDGLKLVTQTDPASRGAAKLTKMRGTVRLVLADKTEQITIDNPFQYLGGKIADPRLEELGIEIAVVSAADVENAPPANRCIVLNYVNKGEHVQGANVLRRLDAAAERPQRDGEPDGRHAGAVVLLRCGQADRRDADGARGAPEGGTGGRAGEPRRAGAALSAAAARDRMNRTAAPVWGGRLHVPPPPSGTARPGIADLSADRPPPTPDDAATGAPASRRVR